MQRQNWQNNDIDHVSQPMWYNWFSMKLYIEIQTSNIDIVKHASRSFRLTSLVL